MRKMLLSLGCMLFVAGLVVADQYTIVSYDKDTKTATLKDKAGKEVTGKLTEKTKVYNVDKEGNKKEGKVGGLEKGWSSPKAAGRKVEVTIVNGEITEVINKGGGKKKKKKDN